MENVLDLSYIFYIYYKIVGKCSNVSLVDLEIIYGDCQGFIGIWEEGLRKGMLGK